MKLPSGITFEEALLGSGTGKTVRGLENGQPVIVKSPETEDDLFGDQFFDEDKPKENENAEKFKTKKEREQKAAEGSRYFIKGRLEEEDGNVFWIRPHVRQSLHQKVSFKETPDSKELAGICQGIIKALIDLNRIDESGHGNLSLGNVLIAGKGVRDFKLVDPLVADEKNERADKRALGLIIYQLVNGEFVELDDKITAVPDDQDWKALGATERLWRDFCSELLNPHGKYAKADWKEISKALGKIEAALSRRKGLKVAFVLSIFAALGVGAFLIWKLKFQEEEIVVDLDTIQGQWVELLDNYFSWGDAYLKSKPDFEQASEAKEFMERFYNEKRARLPMKIIARVTGQGARMQTAPDEVYQDSRRIDVLLLDNSKQQQIVLAHRFVTGLRSEIENWEVLQELFDANLAFIESGFEFGANETRRLIESISFEDGSLTLSRLYALKTSAESLGEMQELYDQFKVQTMALGKVPESDFLSDYAGYLNQQLAKPVEDPVAHLRSLVEDSAGVLAYWNEEAPRIAKDIFSESERDFLSKPGFQISDESLDQWKALVQSFRLIEVPELDSGREEFFSSRGNIQQLNEQINELQEPGLASATFDKKFEKLFKKFQKEVDLPLIESNRATIEAAVEQNLLALKSLVEETEDRWAEVNPDIGERLQQLSEMPEDMSPALAPAWQAYLDQEVSVRTEESFVGPREFILFQREYFSKLKSFEYFQEKQFSQLSSDWPDKALAKLRKELVPALEETRRAYYDKLVSEWVEQIVPVLLSAGKKSSIEAPTDGFLRRMKEYERQLLAYAELLGETLDDFDSWKLPQEGIAKRWSQLNEGNLRQQWGQSEAFIEYSNQVEAYFDLDQETSADAMLAFILDGQKQPFVRSLALVKLSKLEVLSPTQLGQIAEALPDLSEQVPKAEVKDFEATLKSLWTKAFENDTMDNDLRETVFSYHKVMSVRAADLSGRTRFYFEIYSSIADLQSNQEQYIKKPQQLKEFVDTIASLPKDSREPEVEDILADLLEVDISEAKETIQDSPFIQKGWAIAGETEEQLTLAWQDYRLVFHLVKDEDRDFFVAELETSIQLFNDWMTANKLWLKCADSLPREWEVFLSQPYSAIDDYRQGMTLWSIARRGLKRDGLTTSGKWFEVDTVVGDEYAQVESEIFPVSMLDKMLPMQHMGARLAHFFAESMGMSLPTPKQWNRVVENYSAESPLFWQSRLQSDLTAELAEELRSGSYYFDRKIEESGPGFDQEVVLAKVTDFDDGKIKHLAGNIAEYLYDPEMNTYYVAGGSALSATSENWRDEHMVPKRNEVTAFSDVGVRLALIAPEQSAYIQFLKIFEKVLEESTL